MIEITRILLENEMDLILAHKQSMRLAELTGLSISAQTTFATAVSEVSRNVADERYQACLKLCTSDKKAKQKFITAILEDRRENARGNDEGISYAQKLMSNVSLSSKNGFNVTELNYRLPDTMQISEANLERWKTRLNDSNDTSPYEEIRRKNKLLTDVSDRLRESEMQYRILSESLPTMIFTLGPDQRIIYANAWFLNYTGAKLLNIASSNWQQIIHDEDYKQFAEVWDVGIREQQPTIGIPQIRLKELKTGNYRWHYGAATPIKDEANTILFWNAYLVDIHAQKMIEQALKDNKELRNVQATLVEKIYELDQSNQQLERFAYVASHDMQEPLRKIVFYADFIQNKYQEAMPAEAKAYFSNLTNATVRMRLLVQDILAYYTVQKADFLPVSLNQVLKEALGDLEISMETKKAEVHIQELPIIEGIAVQIRQLFENILSNALKFSHSDRKPVIHVTATETASEVTISISDNGIGIEDQNLQKIFDLFQRLHSRDKFEGTGIGLAICKKIVELHSGSISASSDGKGTVFTVMLPKKQLR
jgi:PAS domain S-box-containing protein